MSRRLSPLVRFPRTRRTPRMISWRGGIGSRQTSEPSVKASGGRDRLPIIPSARRRQDERQGLPPLEASRSTVRGERARPIRGSCGVGALAEAEGQALEAAREFYCLQERRSTRAPLPRSSRSELEDEIGRA